MELEREKSLENRPGILMIGSSDVGKRTLLSRLLKMDPEEISGLSSEPLCYGWNIDTKYYTAELSIWLAHLDNGFSMEAIPYPEKLVAVVMVFDLTDLSSFDALQNWIATINIERFEICLCVGNKADLLPGHFAHTEYRRQLQKKGESSNDPHPEYLDYGFLESEGISLIEEEEPSLEIRRSCSLWCVENGIEYIEACGSNTAFDKCLSVDGDSQGIERLYGALSAQMWPGLIMKSKDQISELSSIANQKDTSDEESDYEIEYERLSGGSDDGDEFSPWVSSSEQDVQQNSIDDRVINDLRSTVSDGVTNPEESKIEASTDPESSVMVGIEQHTTKTEVSVIPDSEGGLLFGFEDLERLTNEIGIVRSNLRLMPDSQRREMAANIAMKMAKMFADGSDIDGDEE